MQGVIFTVLSDMLIEKFGMSFWNEILETLELESGGAYTAVVQYSDEELLSIVTLVCDKLSVSQDDILKSYGAYLFPRLLERMPREQLDMTSLFSFLKQVDSVIHREVKRVHPDVYLPSFEYESGAENYLTMNYSSKRQLCSLSEGLIVGAALHFKKKVEIQHESCLKKGDKCCSMVIRLV